MEKENLTQRIASLEGLVLDESHIVTHDANSLGLLGQKYEPVSDWAQGGQVIERHSEALIEDWFSNDAFMLGFIVNRPDSVLHAALEAIIDHYSDDQ